MYFTKAAFTLNRFHWKTALQYSFSSKRCSVYTKSFFVVLSAEVNYVRGMWACRFGKHSKFCMMRCRKCNFVLIDVEVGILLTFLESMKAKVCLYQKYISIFCVYTRKVSIFQVCICFQSFHFGLQIHSLRFHRFSVNGRPKRREKFAFSSKNVLNHFSVNAA